MGAKLGSTVMLGQTSGPVAFGATEANASALAKTIITADSVPRQRACTLGRHPTTVTAPSPMVPATRPRSDATARDTSDA